MNILLELSYWQQTSIRVGLGLVAVLLPAGTLVYLHLFKMVSFMQSRLGPMEAGPYGSLQLVAEVGKFLQKEDIFPRKADRFVFAAAPFVVVVSTFLLVVGEEPGERSEELDDGVAQVPIGQHAAPLAVE